MCVNNYVHFPNESFHSLISGTELGLLMKSCIDQGQLVPDDVISRLILSNLRNIEQSSWLLDGKNKLLPPTTFAVLCHMHLYLWIK